MIIADYEGRGFGRSEWAMEGARDDGSSGDIVRASDGRRARRGFSVAAMGDKEGRSGQLYQRQAQYEAPEAPRRWRDRVVQKLERWAFLYNVTTGLYMLDWWERCIFNVAFVVFFAVAGYNSGHYLQRIGAGVLAWAWWGDSASAQGALLGDGAG